MKLEYPTPRRDSSSDDSDDMIPPTPAAKSTPIVPSFRFRKPSSSSSSSNDAPSRQHLETPRSTVAVHRAQESDSSSDEEAVPIKKSVIVKGEAKSTDSSSSDDEGGFQKVQLPSQLNVNRTVHAMSSSDDSDEDTTTISKQMNRGGVSSEDSNEASARLPYPVKVEKPSSSEDEDRIYAAKFVRPADSSSEEEGRREPEKKNNESSDSSSDDGEEDQKQISRVTDSSSDEEGNTCKPNPLNTKPQDASSSEESSADEKPTMKSVSAPYNQESSDDTSDDDRLPAKLTLNSSQQGKDSSEEESSDEETPTIKPLLPPSKPQQQSSSDESSEDEGSNPARLSINIHQHQPESSDEESSDEGKPTLKPSLPPTSRRQSSSDESSQDEGRNSAYFANISHQSGSGNHESNKERDQETKFQPETSSISRYEHLSGQRQDKIARPSGKSGIALLEETFQEREPLQAGDSSLRIDDIGRDDEVWLLQCPKSMNVSALRKKFINLASDQDIQLEDGNTFKRFTVSPEENINDSINCLLRGQGSNKFEISRLPLKGKVVIQEHIHVPKLKLPEKSAKAPVPLPVNLKVRHPLLGVDFKEYIAQAKKACKINRKSTQNRAINNSLSYSSAERKQKKKDGLVNTNSLESSKVVDKKKKERLNVTKDSVGLDNSNGKGSKSKKKEKHYAKVDEIKMSTKSGENGQRLSWHIPQTTESSVNILPNGLSRKEKKSKNEKLLDISQIKQELDSTGYINGSCETSSSKKRKIKDQERNSLDNFHTPAKRKKHSM